MPNEFETLSEKMDVGFDRVFTKIDLVRDKIDVLKDEYRNHMPV